MGRLDSLQVARGVAASLVFVLHLVTLAGMYSGVGTIATLGAWLQNVGNLGVDIFFVLSGFVIAMTATKPQSSTIQGAVDFIIKRAARIYPLYWMTLAIALLLPAIPGSDNSLDALLTKPASIFLLTRPAAHPLAWTLVYEVQFYILAGLFMLFGARTKSLFLIWAGIQPVAVLAALFGYIPHLPITDGLTLEFCFGVVLALLVTKDAIKHPVAMIALSFAAVIAASTYFDAPFIMDNTQMRAIVWGIPASFVVMSLVSMGARQGARFSKPLLVLGDESYSLYMWHISVLIMTNSLLSPAFPDKGIGFALVYVPLATLLTLAISRISYRIVERPVVDLTVPKQPQRTHRSALP